MNMFLLFDVVEVHDQHMLQAHIVVEVLQEVRKACKKRREDTGGGVGG